MTYATWEIWALIAGMAVGTFLIRFSFLGLIGGRELPPWVQRHLRYTPVAVLPALVAPLVAWPEATGGQPDLARILAALVTAASGYITRSLLAAIACGLGTLYFALYLLG
ncbi:branched-subunit amino acid transport protein [Aliiruegeria haliotis]|uniref:Branched-subunit amino acid transport protein n=1 Tax=Aliiruegeria haliotis TaxID=1280846 RepID=A0A2T0RT30_9RHOB|nr:AzlD domain-containing protein [Aliiruegeria haliotis]PRY24346.1 branched-subunit amino acid transport protein [Aliiruegeria haliotis]